MPRSRPTMAQQLATRLATTLFLICVWACPGVLAQRRAPHFAPAHSGRVHLDGEEAYRRMLQKVNFNQADVVDNEAAGIIDRHLSDTSSYSNEKLTLDTVQQLAKEALEANNINGMVVAVTLGTDINACFALGKADVAKGENMSCKKLVQIGSVSKSINSLLGLYAHHVEALDVNEQVRRYFPQFNPHDTGNEGATLQDLLNHLTGLPRHDSIWQQPYGLRVGISRKSLINSIQYLQHSSPIRYKFTYNNIMYSVAGEAIAHALNSWRMQNNVLDPTELSWSEWIEEVIFAALDMSSTYAEMCRVPPSLMGDLATGYQRKMMGATEQVPRERQNLDSVAPAGGIVSNGNDMLKYLQNFVKEISQKEAGKILKNDVDVFQKPLKAVALSGYGHGIYRTRSAAYSYGLNIEYVDNGLHTQLLQHGGNVYGFSSMVAYLPHYDFGIFVNVNQDASAGPLALVKSVIDRILGIGGQAKYHINDLNRRLLKAYEQVYMEEEKRHQNFIEKYGLLNEATNEGNPNSRSRRLDTACLTGGELQEYVGIYQHPGYGKIEILFNPNDPSNSTINMHFTMAIPVKKYFLHCATEDYYVPYIVTDNDKNNKQFLQALGIFFTTINGKGKAIDSIVGNFGYSQGTPNPLVFTKKCHRNGIDKCAPNTPPMGMTWVDNLSPKWPMHFPR